MAPSYDLHPGLLALMASQGGVFSGVQAQSFGHTSVQIQRLRTGRNPVLVSVRRGVYAWYDMVRGAAPAELHELTIAALALRLDDDAVVSHHSAGVLHRMDLLDADLDVVHVTRGVESRPRLEAGVRHHVADLSAHQIVERPSGLSVTAIARTAVDVARESDRLECGVAAFDAALRAGCSREELRQTFEGCRTWPGARLVSTAIDLADGRSANAGESWSRVVLVQQGVAPTDLQVPVYDAEGLIGYADFGWAGVLGEFDGKGKYGLSADDTVDLDLARTALWKEKRREDRMRVAHEVVRWTVADLHRPALLAGRIRAAQERARWRRQDLGPIA